MLLEWIVTTKVWKTFPNWIQCSSFQWFPITAKNTVISFDFTFPQNFHTKKSGEITVFFAVYSAMFYGFFRSRNNLIWEKKALWKADKMVSKSKTALGRKQKTLGDMDKTLYIWRVPVAPEKPKGLNLQEVLFRKTIVENL